MSEQEKKSGGGAGGSSVVLVEPSATSRHKQPLRSTDITEETVDMHHKHSKAPAVPSAVAEVLKDSDITNVEVNERRESERAMTSEKHKHAAKKLSSTKRRASSPEAITLAPVEVDTKVGSVTPIPAQISEASISEVAEKSASRKEDDSITDDITEMRTTETASEWRDEEEASGLPRSESRSSRASRAARAVRQLLCCGVRLEAPSEHRVSPRPFEGI